MKVRFEFEIDARAALDLEARDFRNVESLDELHMDLLNQPDPPWRVYVNQDDLAALWAAVQELQAGEH